METTPLHTVNFSTIVSESRNIVKANKGHFYALSLFFLPFSISIVVTPTLHSHLPRNFFTGDLFHKFLLSDPIPVVLHLLYILIVYLLTFCGIGTISYSTYNVLIGKPVSYFASLKSLTFSFLSLVLTAILAHTVMFLILLTFLLFGGIIVMLGESLGFVIGFFSITLISFSIIIVKIIYFQMNWCLAFMVVVAESNWGVPALKRSWYLVKGARSVLVSLSSYFLIFFGSYFLIFCGSLVMLFSYNVPVTVDAWSILNMIWLTIIGSLMPMMWSVVNAVLYMHCKAFHGELALEIDEGFDHQYINLPSDDDKIHRLDVVTVVEA
ncbi:unnamed protein product [Lactuca virosa]|uniref:Transmembrane protein n=1 Tax=Lactuca virosa TaxID=75947 RepID=A0AAU9N1F7_9ASTR|nr:unnamed protein product [Lactuca virosa]